MADEPVQTVQTRSLKEEDLEVVCRWTSEGGWNLALRDIQVYYKSYPLGWFAVDVNNEFAGL